MLRLNITTTVSSRRDDRANVWFPFEVEAASIDEVHERLTDDGSIVGNRVTTYEGTDGRRYVQRRERYIVGINTVALIGICQFEYFEPAVEPKTWGQK